MSEKDRNEREAERIRRYMAEFNEGFARLAPVGLSVSMC